MMRYLRVVWLHDFPDEPIELFSELDEQSQELRKVERFRDGTFGFADSQRNSESTRLGLEPIPPPEEIALDPQFQPRMISRAEFDRVWELALASARAGSSIG
ncbi:DUF6881 domain-containing protein [Tundrisphaera sp. TA3]|uniref:DUF6881 domain-containing protein n=1 Tax=Tundrisphaera sp. TA3 TaxID=3435775 RepID=UPI003EBDDDCC